MLQGEESVTLFASCQGTTQFESGKYFKAGVLEADQKDVHRLCKQPDLDEGEIEFERYPEREWFDNDALANAFVDECAGQRNCTATIPVS